MKVLLLSVIMFLAMIGTGMAQKVALNAMDIEALQRDFLKVARLAHSHFKKKMLSVELLTAPHKAPTRLPKGKTAVYVFFNTAQTLKVGKIGTKSKARYTSQHYSPNSSNSNLANSILSDTAFQTANNLKKDNISSWIKTHLSRANFLLDEDAGKATLNLLEAFLQSRLQPKYEGRQK